MERDDNILFDMNQNEIQYFKNFLRTINSNCDTEQLMKMFMRLNNFGILQKIKTLFWKPKDKIHYDVNFIEINGYYDNLLLSPNYTISFMNNYLKYISIVNPKIVIDEKTFFEFYIKEIEKCIYVPNNIRKNQFIIEHANQIYKAIQEWNNITNNSKNENKLEDLNWNTKYSGEEWLFGIPINKKNSKNFNEFMLNGWSFMETNDGN